MGCKSTAGLISPSPSIQSAVTLSVLRTQLDYVVHCRIGVSLTLAGKKNYLMPPHVWAYFSLLTRTFDLKQPNTGNCNSLVLYFLTNDFPRHSVILGKMHQKRLVQDVFRSV